MEGTHLRFRIAGNTLQRMLPALFLGLLWAPIAFGSTNPEGLPSGLDIATRINARKDGKAVVSRLGMELIDRRGKKRERVTRSFRKYYGEEKRTAIFFESPKNLKDTAFLTYDYPEADRDDDQWLYLPAMRKVRRISAAHRGDGFLGTDFTYEDIKKGSKVGIKEHTWRTTGEEEVDGHHCYVVDSLPISEKIGKELGYSRVVLWIDSKIWMIRKSAFWDIRGNPLKIVHAREIREVQGIWTVHRLEAENYKTGHKTVFTFSEVDYQSGVDDHIFTQRALLHGP